MTEPVPPWGPSILAATARAQAALAAQTLRQLNAPIVDALARQRELQTRLAETAQQLATLAGHVEQLARQTGELTEAFQAALDPYLKYVDWLAEAGSEKPR
jgi:chromosome segregation ATPase